MIQYKLILKLRSSLVASFDKKNQTNRQKTEEIRTNHETHVKTFFFFYKKFNFNKVAVIHYFNIL